MKALFPGRYLCIALALINAAGCATQARIGQFKAFADAGGAYQQTVTVVLDSYAASEIERNNGLLIDARSSLQTGPAPCPTQANASLSPRQCMLFAFDAELKQLAATLADLRRQSQLLKMYFEALGALAAYDGDSKVGTSLKGTVDAIAGLSKSLETAKIGAASVSDLAAPIGTMLVGAYRRSALEQELKSNGTRIDDALRVEEAVLRLIGNALANNRQQALERSYFSGVVDPYNKPVALPSDWAATRKAYLLADTDLAVIRNAADAAKALRTAFTALAEGRADIDYIVSVAHDTSELLGIVAKVRGTPNPAGSP